MTDSGVEAPAQGRQPKPVYACGPAVQITINRPEKRNAFTPRTTAEMMRCLDDARDDPDIGVVILTGERQVCCLQTWQAPSLCIVCSRSLAVPGV